VRRAGEKTGVEDCRLPLVKVVTWWPLRER
jgi:hypothetical protein